MKSSQMHFSELLTIFLVYVMPGCALKKSPPRFPSSALFEYLRKESLADWYSNDLSK
jgi:hypothetical protein